MSSIKKGLSSGSDPSLALRIGAGLAVVVAHAVAGSLLFMATESSPKLFEQEQAIMVSVIEAPVPEQAQADPAPQEPQPEVTPPPEPVVEPPPPEPPPPEPEPEPEPEPPPVVEPPPAPIPKPKPKPAPKPAPKPVPKPVAKPVVKPVQTPPPAAPTGNPEGATRNQAPQVAPTPSEPVMLSSVQYRGARPVPNYPRISQRMREEGVAIVLVDIDTTGGVTRAVIDKSSGYDRLDDAALEAARKARFSPASVGGVPRNARAKLPFNFVLRN